MSTGQRATFGLTPPLSRPHRKDGGIFDSGRGRYITFSSVVSDDSIMRNSPAIGERLYNPL